MGLAFDLTLNHPDVTPMYVKATSGGVYAEKSGDAFIINSSSGTIDTTKYWDYDASFRLNGTTNFISVAANGVAAYMAFNTAVKKEAGQRLVAAYCNDLVTAGLQGLYQWYLDNNNYEILYLDLTATPVVKLNYKVVVGGVTLFNISDDVSALISANKWNVFQVSYFYRTTGGNARRLTLMVNGQLTATGFTTDASAGTTVTFNGKLEIGRVTIGGVDYYLNGYFDMFLVRKGLPFNNDWMHQPTTPAWQGGAYLNKPYEGGVTVVKDLGTLAPIAPSIFPENDVPQGIPDFTVFRDVLYITGINNYKVYKMTPYYGVPDVTVPTSFSANIRNNQYLSIFQYVALAAGGTVDAGSWLYGISLFNSSTGEETDISGFIGATNGSSTAWTSNPVVTTGAEYVSFYIQGPNDTGFFDKIKVWRKRTTDSKVFYVGMVKWDDNTLDAILITSNSTINEYKDNNVTTDLQEFTYFNRTGNDLMLVDTIGVDKPTGVTIVAGGAVANGFITGNHQGGAVNIDPRTGTISGVTVSPITNLILGPGAINTTISNSLGAAYRTLPCFKQVSAGDAYFYFTRNSTFLLRSEHQAVNFGPFAYLPSDLRGGYITDETLNKPQPCNYVKGHQDRLWYGCFKGAKNKLMWSDIDQPELVSDNAYIFVGNDSEPITGLIPFGGVLVVFKEHSTWIITGNSPETYDAQVVSDNIGCIAHRSIQTIDNAVYFCSMDGPYIFNGSFIIPINDDVRDLFNEMDNRMRPLISSAVDRENNLYLLAIRSSSTQIAADTIEALKYNYNSDKLLVYDYKESDVSNKIFRWTTYDISVSDLTAGKLNINRRSNVIGINLIPNSGSNPGSFGSGIGFLNVNSFKDLGNWSTSFVSWSAIFNPYSSRLGRNNEFTEVNFAISGDKMTTPANITIGYNHRGTDYTSVLVANNGVEKLQKKMSIRGMYVGALISGSTQEELRILGYEFITKKVGYR